MAPCGAIFIAQYKAANSFRSGYALTMSESNSTLITRDRLTYLFLGLVAWLPLPLGSKHPWAISIAETWCFLLAIFALLHFFRTPEPLPRSFRTAKIAFMLLSLNLCWLLIQCLPLPISLLELVSPHTAQLYLATGAGISSASISVDTYATWQDFVEAAYLMTFFALALYLFDSRDKIRWLVYTVLLSALFQAIYGGLMILTGAEYSFFISKAAIHSHVGSATGTFSNRDHLAGYLEMALALGIGYMLSMLSNSLPSQNWRIRILQWSELLLGAKARLRLILILLCLGLVLTHSRGGNLGFFTSLAVAGGFFLLLARRKPRSTVIFLSSLIILDIILIGSWVGVSKVMTRLEQTSMQTESRDEAVFSTLPMLQDYWLTGSGAGTYFEMFPAYKEPGLPDYWSHAHNDYLEILTDQGLIGFSLLAGTVVFALFTILQALRKRRSQLMLGMSFASLMGIVAILIHSTVDFNLQILANSSLFMLLLALAMICRRLQGHGSAA